jgi:hypothetical protein
MATYGNHLNILNHESAVVSGLDKHPLLCGNGELLQAVLVDEGSNIEYELDPVNPSDR